MQIIWSGTSIVSKADLRETKKQKKKIALPLQPLDTFPRLVTTGKNFEKYGICSMVSEPFKYISEKAWPDQPFEIVHRI